MNGKKVKLRFLKILFTRFPVLLAFSSSLFFLILGWAVDFKFPLLKFLPLACLIVAIGFIAQLFFVSGDKIAEQAINEVNSEEEKVKTAELDYLYEILKTEDNDPTNEKLLQDLREITNEIHKVCLYRKSEIDGRSSVEISLKVDELLNQCLTLLKRSVDLWKSARNISSVEVRNDILAQRENILKEVDKSKIYLGKILVRIQEFNISKNSGDSELAKIRNDLDQELKIARRVQKSMKTWEKGDGVLEK